MIFVHPLALFGLVAAAIPALLHLLQRRTPPEQIFPAVRYLTEAERRSARQVRLRHLLLLMLRTLLVVLLVLAAARPQIRVRSSVGPHPPTAAVVILDNSPSAGAVSQGRPELDRLKAAARAVLSRAAPAGDRLFLMLADGVLRGGSREELRAIIDSSAVAPQRLDLVMAASRATRALDAEPLAAREVFVASDEQRTALAEGRLEPSRRVRIVALAPVRSQAVPVNRGVGQVRVTESAVVATIVGTPGAGPVPVTLRIKGQDVSRGLGAPGAAVSLPLPPVRSQGTSGWEIGEVALEPDELRADDRRVFAWHEVPPAGVTATAGAGPFVAAALAVLEAGHRVSTGQDVLLSDAPGGGSGYRVASVIVPPADPALVGQVNRAISGRGGRWTFGSPGTPGQVTAGAALGGASGTITGAQVTKRLRLDGPTDDSGSVLARVNGEPWLVRSGDLLLVGSRLDTAWTALPATPAFVPFVDALVNRLVRGEAGVTQAEGSVRVAFTVVGADTIGAVEYGPDPRESDLTPASVDVIHSALQAEVLDDAGFGAAAFAGLGRSEITGVLLALALAVALIESGVAARVS